MRQTHAIRRDLEHLDNALAALKRIGRPAAAASVVNALDPLRQELYAELGAAVAAEPLPSDDYIDDDLEERG